MQRSCRSNRSNQSIRGAKHRFLIGELMGIPPDGVPSQEQPLSSVRPFYRHTKAARELSRAACAMNCRDCGGRVRFRSSIVRRITRLSDLFDCCFLNSGLHFLDSRLSITSRARPEAQNTTCADWARCSGDLLPPSPPSEQAKCHYQTRQTSADVGNGNGGGADVGGWCGCCRRH
jgi:hypothetical protein